MSIFGADLATLDLTEEESKAAEKSWLEFTHGKHALPTSVMLANEPSLCRELFIASYICGYRESRAKGVI